MYVHTRYIMSKERNVGPLLGMQYDVFRLIRVIYN